MANTYSGGTLANVGNNAAYMTIGGSDTGLVMGGLTCNVTIDTKSMQFWQDASPRAEQVSNQTLTLDLTLAEMTLANIKKYLGDLATISGEELYYGTKKGEFLTTYEVKLYPLHPDGHPLAGKVFTFHKCSLRPNGPLTIDPTEDVEENLPLQVVVHKDTTQTAGQEFFTITAADDTAPTVSSTTPTDGATDQSATVTIVVNFDMAMGHYNVGTDDVIIAKSDFSSFVTPTALSWDSDYDALSITHPIFVAGTEYVVILSTRFVSAAGVPMDDAYEFDFTIIA